MKSVRIVELFNLGWKFHRNDAPEAWYKGFDDSAWQEVTLPHDWSVEEPFNKEHSSGTGYLPGGIGWYRKTFSLPSEMAGKKVFITFEGIYNNSQVWINSNYLGKRPYGYSTFTYDLTPFIRFGQQENTISVRVNHNNLADSRWYTGSGIYRNVYLTITDKVHIPEYSVFVTTPLVTEKEAEMAVDVTIRSDIRDITENDDYLIKNTLLDASGAVVAFLESRSGKNQRFAVPNPELWSPDHPYLYTLVTQVIKSDQVLDQVETPVGIRWFFFDPDKGFFLNGVNMKIKGVCVHHDAGCLGAAVPKQVWERRLEALKEMGCNAIRMSHNPPAPDLLDLCDKMGFLVIDEAFDEWEGPKNKWWQGHNVYPPKHYGYSEDFPEWHERDLRAMVLRDRNHPSIILWSIGNEIDYPNDPYCHPWFKSMTGNNDANKPAKEREYDPNKPNAERLPTISKHLVDIVKDCDKTRPVTAAIAFPELSNLTGYTDTLDVVGYNYKEHLYEEDHSKYKDRVLFGSENGHDLKNWLIVRDTDYISAQFIWTGVDFLGEAKGWPVRVSTCGFLDLAGFKKPRFYYRKSLWQDEPFIYLTVKKNKDEQTHWNFEPGDKLEVICYTNCEEAELLLNNETLGKKHRKDFPEMYITYTVDYRPGILKAIGITNGKPVEASLVTAGKAAAIRMSSDRNQLAADGQDIAHIEIEVVDEQGNRLYSYDSEIEVAVEGSGTLLGLENGNPEDLEPYSSPKRRIFRGNLLAYVRSSNQQGILNITARSKGLSSSRLSVGVE